MKTNAISPLTDTLSDAGLGVGFQKELREIQSQRLKLTRQLYELLEKLDTREKATWKIIVVTAFEAGVSEDEIQRELGASPSTIWRWRCDDGAPREGTRRLMKSALLTLVRDKITALESAISSRSAATRRMAERSRRESPEPIEVTDAPSVAVG